MISIKNQNRKKNNNTLYMELNLEYNALMITQTISAYKGKNQSWLEENINWLKNISSYGVSMYLQEAEKRGYIKSKSDG